MKSFSRFMKQESTSDKALAVMTRMKVSLILRIIASNTTVRSAEVSPRKNEVPEPSIASCMVDLDACGKMPVILLVAWFRNTLFEIVSASVMPAT